jgi:hypothetical protein
MMKRAVFVELGLSRLSSCQNACVIWKSLPWWLIASRNAWSRANTISSRAELVPMVSSDWPCRSAQ